MSTTDVISGSAVIYPSAISRACAAIDETVMLMSCPDGYLRVLIRLIKKIDCQMPWKPIFASRETISRESGKSLETVARALRWFEEHGIITRNKRARKNLKGSVSPIAFSTVFLKAVGLEKPDAESAKQLPKLCADTDSREDAHATPLPDAPGGSPVKTDASISVNQAVSKREQSGTRALRVQGFVVPEDLSWLCTRQGLAPTALFALMKMAKSVGQTLSLVVEATRHYLANIKGRNLFAYLRKLIKSGKDFVYVAQTQKAEACKKQEAAALDAARESLAGKRLERADGSKRFWVEKNGLVGVESDGSLIGYFPLNMEFVGLIEKGEIVVSGPSVA